MIVYLILALMIWLFKFSLIDKYHKEKLFIVFSFICITLVAGLRGKSVGLDTHTYFSIFENVKYLSFKDILSSFPTSFWSYDKYGLPQRIETFYLIYLKLISVVFKHYVFSQIITAAIISWGFGKYIYENCSNKFIGVYTFMCESLFISSFNLQRQVLAMAIVCLAISLLKEKKIVKSFIVVVFASLIHSAMIVCLFLFLLGLVKKYRRFIKIQIVLTLVVPLLLPLFIWITSLYSNRYVAYFSMNNGSSPRGILIIWFIEIAVFALLYRKSECSKEEFYIFSTALLYFGSELMGITAPYLSRLALIFAPSMILLFDHGIELFEMRSKRIYCACIYLVLTGFYFKYITAGTAMTYSFFWH